MARRTARGLRVRLLGRFGVEVDGVEMRLRGVRRRAVLAALLLNSGRSVAAEHLVERVWGEPTTQANRSALQVHVARIRSLFDEHCADPLVRGGDGGYRVDLEESESDLLAFRSLVGRAEEAASTGDAGSRTDLLVRALELWRGPVLADVVSPVLHDRDIPALHEELLRAAEEGFGAALARGDHERVAHRIGPIVTDHPEREPLVRIQMVALYRGGRPSEALRTYARTRSVLAERLGADPGRELQEAFHGILRDDLDDFDDLDGRSCVPRQRVPRGHAATAPPGGAALPRARARTVPGDASAPPGPVRAPAPVSGAATPAELPAALPFLVGRDEALAELDRLVDPCGPAPGGALVRGPAGAGASALAVRWAHTAAPHFPDGQLYVNLRSGDGTPREPAEVLRRLVRALSTGTGDTSGMGTDESAARMRTLVARRRILLVLDNASSTRQVRPLLPGGTGCATVVTSRYWLTDLLVRDGLRVLPVGTLSPGDAVGLLGALVGRGQYTEASLRRVARLAGHLPLPLRMAAAWLETHPHKSAADLARRVEKVDPARGVTPTARLAAVLHAGPEEGRHGRGEVPAGSGPPHTSLDHASYIRLSSG